MEARLYRSARRFACVATFCLLALETSVSSAQIFRGRMSAVRPHQAQSENFIVFASSPDWARQVAETAEAYRRDLAMHWLGKELPTWGERCPIHVTAGPNLNASGETKFSPTQFGVGNWMMSVNGTPERVLDSVLPHEISHTIFATHFAAYAHQNRFVPRWADEGACTTVEHESEKRKHRHYLRQFLQTGRGLAFNQMFGLKEYPSDILPLYAQGHSAVQFLIDQSSPRDFVKFLEQGMQTLDWERSLRDHFGYKTIGEFQTLWNKWLFDGSPNSLMAYAPGLQNQDGVPASLASTPFRNRQLDGKVKFAITSTDPAPAQLASSENGLAESSEASYYKRRLNAVQSGQDLEANLDDVSRVSQGALPSTNSALADAPSMSLGGFNQVSVPESVRVPGSRAPGSQATQAAAYPQTAASQLANSQALPANPHSGMPTMSGQAFHGGRVRNHSASRQQPPQSPQVQVLDWGASLPVQGHSGFGPQVGSARLPQPGAQPPQAYGPQSQVMVPISSLPQGHIGPVQMVPVYR